MVEEEKKGLQDKVVEFCSGYVDRILSLLPCSCVLVGKHFPSGY